MSLGFTIPEKGSLDLLSLGALVHRLDPGIIPWRKATEAAIHVSGGEFNVAADLADCFRLRTGIAAAMVDYPNGGRGPNMATVYSDRGLGARPPVVFYNRSDEAAARLAPGDFDWQAIFAEGVRWFHSGGIFASLSDTTAELTIEAMKAAKKAGAVTSFDLNYREKLWKTRGGAKRAQQVLSAIVENVDVLLGNEEDLQKGLGFAGPEVAAKSKLDPSAFFAMIGKVTERFPRVKVVATTLREVHSTNHHSWSAVAWVNGDTVQAPTAELNVYDRVGGGDGFAAGFIFGLLKGETAEQAVRLGWAHGALLTTFPGDTTMATEKDVRAFAQGGSARIQR
jgi:2-dehydro-3-deoxygluconokinase